MSEKKDTFWKLFFIFTSVLLVMSTAAAFVVAARQGLLSFNVPRFDPNRDPFAYAEEPAPVVATSTSFYREALPLGYSNSSWDAQVVWASTEKSYKGTHSIKATYTKEGGGAAMQGPSISTSDEKGISLAVMPEAGINDLYLALFDKHGNEIGEQSLGWYTPQGSLKTGVWQVVDVPLANFATTTPGSIAGFGVVSLDKGVAYIDSVHLTATTTPHAAWKEPPFVDKTAVTYLMAHAPTTTLPYALAMTPQGVSAWHSLYGGLFMLTQQSSSTPPTVALGPSANGDAMTILLGSHAWGDYRVDTLLDWGEARSYSILLRFTDDANFASCAFSQDGAGVQIYYMHKGISQLLAESPSLPSPDLDAWYHTALSASVKGNTITCYVKTDQSISATIPGLSPTGAIGVEVWDPSPYPAPHHLISLSANPL
jgi:hypothetical protein